MTRHTRSIPFLKASACGNDFLLIERSLAPEDIAGFTKRICDRHNGVGADGVEWISPHFSADAEIHLVNADGSFAEISGNGTRCVAAYLYSKQPKDRISILTGAGNKVCTMTGHSKSGYEFEIEMGEAVVEAELALNVGKREVRGVPVSMGNPHYVIFVPEFPAEWQARAAEVQRNPHFREGVNVELVESRGKHEIRARFFERGAGETQSSGTGSCAAAAAAMATRRAESPVKVQAPGGTQVVRKEGKKIFLAGSAHLVCQGEFFVS
ncbi:MAG TPA: diaminopimelate epimerase [Candidatus Sulfotelmatobacter sp.]|nr:diaminopimelate epimerase [Candidatus Sulfotelmatobacter sp.]